MDENKEDDLELSSPRTRTAVETETKEDTVLLTIVSPSLVVEFPKTQ